MSPHSDVDPFPCTSGDCLPLADGNETFGGEPDVSPTEQSIMLWICYVGYVFSTLLCLGSLYVFRHFSKLWCLRNLVHANLIGCIVLHNVGWLALALLVETGGDFCALTALLVELTKFGVTSTFCWMLVEGAYLYMSILHCLHAHRIKYWMCAAIGWGLPLALVVYGISLKWRRAVDGGFVQTMCAFNENLDNLTVWVIIVILATNAVIVFAVIYVLISKFRQISDKEWAGGLRHSFRALLFLCPLLGVNYVFTIYHPQHPQWLSTAIAFYTVTMSAFQGTFISIFFCFNHEEVRSCLYRSFQITQNSIRVKVYEMRRKSMEESQMTFLGSPDSHVSTV